jgi:hypothetical protein
VFELNGNPSNIEIVRRGLWSSDGKLLLPPGHDAQDSPSGQPTPTATRAGIKNHEIEVYSFAEA